MSAVCPRHVRPSGATSGPNPCRWRACMHAGRRATASATGGPAGTPGTGAHASGHGTRVARMHTAWHSGGGQRAQTGSLGRCPTHACNSWRTTAPPALCLGWLHAPFLAGFGMPRTPQERAYLIDAGGLAAVVSGRVASPKSSGRSRHKSRSLAITCYTWKNPDHRTVFYSPQIPYQRGLPSS